MINVHQSSGSQDLQKETKIHKKYCIHLINNNTVKPRAGKQLNCQNKVASNKWMHLKEL